MTFTPRNKPNIKRRREKLRERTPEPSFNFGQHARRSQAVHGRHKTPRRLSHTTYPSRSSLSRNPSGLSGGSRVDEALFKSHNPEYTLRVLLDAGALGASRSAPQKEQSSTNAIHGPQDSPPRYVNKAVMVTPRPSRVSPSRAAARQDTRMPSLAASVGCKESHEVRRHTRDTGTSPRSYISPGARAPERWRASNQGVPRTPQAQPVPRPVARRAREEISLNDDRQPPGETLQQYIQRIEAEVFGRDGDYNSHEPSRSTESWHRPVPTARETTLTRARPPRDEGDLGDGYIEMSKFWRPNHLL